MDGAKAGSPHILEAEGPPLDYSFKELRSCAELPTEQPRNARKASPKPDRSAAAQDTGLVEEKKAAGPKKVVQLLTNSIRMNNNYLESLKELPAALQVILPQPERLVFLDVSWNMLASIHPCILQYQNLKALYLHGNKIASMPQVSKLTGFPILRSLTLNGNPIETNSGYRLFVIGSLQHDTALRSLDHSTITDDERERAEAWSLAYEARKEEARKRREEAAYRAEMG
jgi:hypothetical protein